MSTAKAIPRSETTSLRKNDANGVNHSRDGSNRCNGNGKSFIEKISNGGDLNSNHLEDGEVSQRCHIRNQAGSTRQSNGISSSTNRREQGKSRSRTQFRDSVTSQRMDANRSDQRWRSNRDTVGNRSRDSSSARSKNEARYPQSGRNGLNRHELQSWKRMSGLPQEPRRCDLSTKGITRTGSSLSKKSVVSDPTSKSSPKSDSSLKVKFLSKKDIESDKTSKTTSSSRTNSPSGNGTPSKRKKFKSTSLAAVESCTPKPETNGLSLLSQQEQPLAVHGDWTVHSSKGSGRQYYFNTKTKVSQWHKPDEVILAESTVDPSKSEVKSPKVETTAPKRKASVLGSPDKIEKPARLTKRMNTALLGSPISDDDVESVASPTRSEQMDISDNISNASVTPSKNAATVSSRSSPSRGRNIPLKEKPPEISPNAKRKTKAPTMENMRILHGADDPDKRRTEKFERVASWMSTLEPASTTPAEFSRSPGIADTGSPVSSGESASSRKLKFSDSTSVLDYNQISSLSTTSSLHVPWRTYATISLPSYDFPDFPEVTKSDTTSGIDISLTGQFRSLKVISYEDQHTNSLRERIIKCGGLVLLAASHPGVDGIQQDRVLEPSVKLNIKFAIKLNKLEGTASHNIPKDRRCKNASEARPRAYALAGEKSITMKSTIWDINQKRITMMFQTEDISFLTSLEEELSKTMHPRLDPKPDPQKAHVKMEMTDSDVKEEPGIETKMIVDYGNSFSKAAASFS